MLRTLLFSFVTTVAAQQCTSLATLVHGTTGAPQGLSTPDCSYIQANAAAICNTLSSWEIINGNACQLRGPGYGCQFSNSVFSTQETFYCQVGPAPTSTASNTAVATVSPSASGSASQSVAPSFSPSASVSATYSPSSSPSPSETASVSASASPATSPSPTVSVSTTRSPLATFSSSLSPVATVSSTGTATSTSTHTINPVYIYVNTTNYVPVSVTDTTIGKGQAAAIGLSAIFGFTFLSALCFAIFRRVAPKEDPSRRPSTVIIREPVSRRPSVAPRRSSTVKSEV